MDSKQSTSGDAAMVESELVMDELADESRRSPFRRFRSVGGRGGADTGYLERIEAELVLLREENARMRLERAQRPDAGSMIDNLKTLSAASAPDEERRDHTWSLISQTVVMREVLLDVCKEIGQTVITLQTRLNELGLDLPESAGAPATATPQRRSASPAQHELRSSRSPSASPK
jgi:hypothetical protein